MTNDQPNARELLALKRTLHDALSLAEIRAINWPAIANVVALAFDRGWRGDELAKFAIEGLDRADDAGAVIYTTLRDLSTVDPPRDSTNQPPPAAQVLAAMRTRPASAQRRTAAIDTIQQTLNATPAPAERSQPA